MEIINKLRSRIIEYRNEKVTKDTHSAIIHDVIVIDLMLSFAELGFVRNRPISREEEHWFIGTRFLDDVFGADEEWEDIYIMYIDLVEEVKGQNYFRANP